jgi:prepilin-type N-terminal cleavage/methylation domain-containing protein
LAVTNRRGFTLIETLMVLGVAAVLLAISWPKVKTLMVKANVRSARSAVIGYYQQGRMRALQSGRPTTIWFSSNRMWVTASPRRNAGTGTYDTLGYVYDFNQRYGVAVAASPDTTVSVNARGLGISANSLTLALTRAGIRDSIVINQIGRVTK